jgi:urease accessory protein
MSADHTHEHHHHDDHCDHTHDVMYNKVVKAHQKVASALLRNAKTIALTFDQRQEVPHTPHTTDGQHIACRIEDPIEVGDKLVSNTNEWVIVQAASEPLFHIAKGQPHYDTFLHIAGLAMWPVELTDSGLHVLASQECMHMVEHFGLEFSQLEGPMHEIVPPELEEHAHCGHDHEHHEHGPDCNHSH